MKTSALISYGLRLGRDLLRLLQQIGTKPRRSEARPEIPEETGNLPEAYGETRVVLLPVHPYLIHAYWELTREDLERVKSRLGEGATKPVLRFYDITCLEFDGTNAHSYFDVEIDLRTNQWKVNLRSPEKSYIAELRFKKTEEEYLVVARSNVAHTPRAWPSAWAEPKYMNIGEDPRNVGAVSRVDTFADGSGSVGEVSKVDFIPGGINAFRELVRDRDPQAPRGVEWAQPERKVLEPQPAAEFENRFSLSELPRPIGPLEKLSWKLERLYEPRKGEGHPSKTHEPNRIDFTELGERNFTSGLSSRSK